MRLLPEESFRHSSRVLKLEIHSKEFQLLKSDMHCKLKCEDNLVFMLIWNKDHVVLLGLLEVKRRERTWRSPDPPENVGENPV